MLRLWMTRPSPSQRPAEADLGAQLLVSIRGLSKLDLRDTDLTKADETIDTVETEEMTEEALRLRTEVDTQWLHLCDLTADTTTVEEAVAAMAADTLIEGTTDETIARTTEIDATMVDETTTLAAVIDETAITTSEGTSLVAARLVSCKKEDETLCSSIRLSSSSSSGD